MTRGLQESTLLISIYASFEQNGLFRELGSNFRLKKSTENAGMQSHTNSLVKE